MKTQNNNQETSKSQVNKMTLRLSVVLVSIVLISFSVSAQDLWKELSNTVAYGKMTLTLDEQSAETKNADDAIDAINSELAIQLSNPNESFTEVVPAESPVIETKMTIENFINDAEQQTAESADNEIATYAEKILTIEGKEEGLTIESPMTNDTFFQVAEQQTAEGADNEIAKYAEKIMTTEEKEESLAIETWMTNDTFFQDAERFTADGADLQIAHYAEETINNEKVDRASAIESWRLDSENLSD